MTKLKITKHGLYISDMPKTGEETEPTLRNLINILDLCGVPSLEDDKYGKGYSLNLENGEFIYITDLFELRLKAVHQ